MKRYTQKNAPQLSHWQGGYFLQCPHRLKGRGAFVMRYLHPQDLFQCTPNSALHWEIKMGLIPSKASEHSKRVAYLLKVQRYNKTRKGDAPKAPLWIK